MSKKQINDARLREVLARKRAAQRAARMQQAVVDTSKTGLRKIVRLPEVEIMVGRGRTSILADVAKGLFPKPMRLGPRRVGWLISEIEGWISARSAERDHNDHIADKDNDHIAA